MFDRLIDVLIEFADHFKAFVVVGPNIRGVIMRWGVAHRQVENGFNWMWPVYEQVALLSLATRVEELSAQTLITKDGRNVLVGVVVTYRVHDVHKAMFDVYEPFMAIHDAVQAEVASRVQTTDYADVKDIVFLDTVRKRGFKYGFEIDDVRISEFAPTRTYRLVGNGMEL